MQSNMYLALREARDMKRAWQVERAAVETLTRGEPCVLATIILISVFAKGVINLMPILFAIIVGYLVSLPPY